MAVFIDRRASLMPPCFPILRKFMLVSPSIQSGYFISYPASKMVFQWFSVEEVIT